MQERGCAVDHSTVQRWVVHYAPRIEKAFRENKKRVGLRWRLDETYIKIRGDWKYLYRAVDKQGNTIDFLLTARRDKKAALRFLNRAIGSNGKPRYKKYKWVVEGSWLSRKWSRNLRSWMRALALPAVSTRIADLVDLFRSPSKPGTNNSVPTNSSVASLR